MFERIEQAKAGNKKKYLEKFFTNYHSDDYFPLMRMLLPQLDKERQTYGMKESNLGKFFVELLNIAPTSEDAVRLIHWKKPTGSSIKIRKLTTFSNNRCR